MGAYSHIYVITWVYENKISKHPLEDNGRISKILGSMVFSPTGLQWGFNNQMVKSWTIYTHEELMVITPRDYLLAHDV